MGDVISDNGKRGSSRRSVKAALLGTAAIYLVAGLAGDIVDTAHAQVASQNAAVTTNTFNIRPQELGSALTAFADSAELRLLFPSSLVAGKRSPGISGNLTREQALSRLLAGTGLTWRFTAANTVTIVDPAASNEAGNINADGSLVLDTITVQGQAINNWDAPPEYPGGQVARGGQLGILGNVDIMNAPFSITSYTAKHLSNQQATNLQEALRDEPSIRTESNPSGNKDYFKIRGFGAGPAGFQELSLNGLPAMAPATRIQTELFERVEVLKGPSALLSGTTNDTRMGGNVNLVTKRATNEPINEVTVGYATSESARTHVDFGRRWGDAKEFGLRVNGVLGGGEIEINDVDRQVKAGSIGLDYRGDRFRTSLDVLYHNYTITGNTAVPVLGAGTAVPRPIRAGHNWIPHNGKTHIEDYSIVSQSEYDLTPDWTLFSKFGYHYWDWHLRGIGTGLVQSNGDYTPFISDTGRYQKDSVAEIGIRGKFSTWDIDHSVAVSGSYNHREVGIGNYGSVFTGIRSNLYNPIFINYPKFERTKDPLTDKYNFSSFAITDTMSLFDERLLITAGLRYQNIAHRKFAVDGSVTSRSDVGALTPSLGVVVKPIENVSIYASYIEGLTPGFEVTDSLAPNFGAVFDPVRTKSYEAGVKWDLGRFSTTVALFQISEPSISADSSQVYSQNGMKRVRGLEWNVFGEVTPELRVLGGLAFMDGRVVETADGLNDGNKASGVPNVQANLGIEWDTPWVRGLTLTGRFTHTGSQYVRSDNTQKIPSWNRVDLGARYETTVNGSPLTIRASVDNVFNKSYWESTYYDLFLIPNSPRTYRLSATVKF